MLIPGYTTRGVSRIETKCVLKTREVNFEFANITSALPVEDELIPIIFKDILTCCSLLQPVHG
jgi:hypothetical protein